MKINKVHISPLQTGQRSPNFKMPEKKYASEAVLCCTKFALVYFVVIIFLCSKLVSYNKFNMIELLKSAVT